jgi:hypothetical protein
MNDISGQCQQVCDTIVKFYSAIKASYPDIKIISSCDRSAISSHNPADLYDVHVMTVLLGFLIDNIFPSRGDICYASGLYFIR